MKCPFNSTANNKQVKNKKGKPKIYELYFKIS
jgi:hypothetical protein